MKAITILQPYASLIPEGLKHIETRSWATKYRGKIAIHAAKKPMTNSTLRIQGFLRNPYRVPYGAIIAIADLVDCVRIEYFSNAITLVNGMAKYSHAKLANGIEISGNELLFGYYADGNYAWILENIQPIAPIPAKGQQGLWNWNEMEAGRNE